MVQKNMFACFDTPVGLPLTLSGLREEFRIKKPSISIGDDFLSKIDNAGIPFLTMGEYRGIVSGIKKLTTGLDRKYVLKYLEYRIGQYNSSRLGRCVALRGERYYRPIVVEKSSLYQKLKEDFLADAKMHNFLVGSGLHWPAELYLLVLDHLKNLTFKVMYTYYLKSINMVGYFKPEAWRIIDNTVRVLWEMIMEILFTPNYHHGVEMSFYPMARILDSLSDQPFGKLREMDSLKSLVHFAYRVYEEDEGSAGFDVGMPLMYGGVEIPYAIDAYSSVISGKPFFKMVVPIVFSFNRIKKGLIPNRIINSDGLIDWDEAGSIIPRPLFDLLPTKNPKTLLVDNNITTGYSIGVLRKSLIQLGHNCQISVAEVNVQEMKAILEERPGFETKRVMLSGVDLAHCPIGEYTTCFGFTDSSEVIKRVRVVLGVTGHRVIGYDFDGTIFKTGQLHRMAWNRALEKMGYTVDVIEMPSNKSKTAGDSASAFFDFLQAKGAHLPQLDDFVTRVIEIKNQVMLEVRAEEIISIARAVNLIKGGQNETRIVVSNGCLPIILDYLAKKELLMWFKYIICERSAYCIESGEEIALKGAGKPDKGAYCEAVHYFNIPRMSVYYGDDASVDSAFAKKIKAQFIKI